MGSSRSLPICRHRNFNPGRHRKSGAEFELQITLLPRIVYLTLVNASGWPSLEQEINRQNPPPITHPMFFYGFIDVTLAWQLLFFAIARQPMRLRPAIPFAVLEKLSFEIGAMLLYRQNRLDHNDLWFGCIDLILAGRTKYRLFLWELDAHFGIVARTLRLSKPSEARTINASRSLGGKLFESRTYAGLIHSITKNQGTRR